MRITRLGSLLLTVLLAGCNATSQTLPQGEPVLVERGEQATGGPEQAPARPVEAQTAPAMPSQNQFDQLSGRLTLMQEQLLQLRSDNQLLMEQNKMVLNRLQLITSSVTMAAPSADQQNVAPSSGGSEQLDMAIGQLMQVLNEVDNPAVQGGEYSIATTYTRNGDWILLRYHRSSGATWLADSGEWSELQEQQAPEQGSYQVLVHRADQDRKGYVAVRVDGVSGRSWWLNDTRWQEYTP